LQQISIYAVIKTNLPLPVRQDRLLSERSSTNIILALPGYSPFAVEPGCAAVTNKANNTKFRQAHSPAGNF
jgi:hypothetical protein